MSQISCLNPMYKEDIPFREELRKCYRCIAGSPHNSFDFCLIILVSFVTKGCFTDRF